MHELGFQACCLWCDAPDTGAQQRCGACIRHHRTVRERLAARPAEDPLGQLAKEIMAMAAAPHRHDHDEVHGATLMEQQRRAHALNPSSPAPTQDDVEAVFERLKQREKTNVLRDIADRSTQTLASSNDAVRLGEGMFSVDQTQLEHYGARTVPSQPIAPVDRSPRTGEDTALTDRIQVASDTPKGLDDDAVEILEAIEVRQRQSDRQALKQALEDAKNLVDDDLDF